MDDDCRGSCAYCGNKDCPWYDDWYDDEYDDVEQMKGAENVH